MPFKLPEHSATCPEDPEALFRDLRKRTVPGLLSHQADILRSYIAVHKKHTDVAIQLPTGSGKTLVGLLIAEWRRRKYGERVVYLCPTRQLVNQVSDQARSKYGIDIHAFTGKKADYPPAASADWKSADAVAVTTYNSLFNTNPFFSDANLIILDDAHSAENYVSTFWSMQIDRFEETHKAAFSAISGLVIDVLPHADKSRLAAEAKKSADDDYQWVEKLPTPTFQQLVPELVSLLDEHTQDTDLYYPWSVLRESLHACHFYVSRRAILIRPLIPPSTTHAPFAHAKQRIYMSATLGAGGDLERVTGRYPIHRIPVPSGWDKQGIGRRFFLFPKRSLEDDDTDTFVAEAIKLGGRALFLVPDEATAQRVRGALSSRVSCDVFNAKQLEQSKQPFVESANAVAVVANRYDGIDLVDDDCRLLLADGLPRGANLQERFLVNRVGAHLLLDDRVLTRLVQGFGRCTRSPNDYAAVLILGETLNNYLFKKENKELFHPEIQAEMDFGLLQSRDATIQGFLTNLEHFFARDSEWELADQAIVSMREKLSQRTLTSTSDLSDAVAAEISYQSAIWNGDFSSALEHCRTVLGKLNHPDLRGYRALWMYLAGSAAWLAHRNGTLPDIELAKDFFRKAQAAAPVLRWLVALRTNQSAPSESPTETDAGITALVERLEIVLDNLGMMHDRKYDAEERFILGAILQTDDGKLFEQGRERLGKMLGYETGHSSDDAAPDPWWVADDETCFVFEDNAEGDRDTVFSATKARQAASHPAWIRENAGLCPTIEIIPIVITPRTKTTRGAIPSLRNVRYWSLDAFCTWAQTALQVIRDLRRDFSGMGNLAWRTSAAARLQAAHIGPDELRRMLKRSAADAMTVDGAPDEESN